MSPEAYLAFFPDFRLGSSYGLDMAAYVLLELEWGGFGIELGDQCKGPARFERGLVGYWPITTKIFPTNGCLSISIRGTSK